MKITNSIRIAGLVLATTIFYGYVGQLVPQKEVQPPQEMALKTDISTAEMAKIGREIMDGKGLCLTCHTIGKTGALRFPDLAGVDARAGTRVPGLNDVEYFAQSMYEPTAFVVPGFPPAIRDICTDFGISSPNGVMCHLKALETKGYINRVQKHKNNKRAQARGITIPGVTSGGFSLPLVGVVAAGKAIESAEDDQVLVAFEHDRQREGARKPL